MARTASRIRSSGGSFLSMSPVIEGEIRSTMSWMFSESAGCRCSRASMVAAMAPHPECPITTTSGVPNFAAANSMLPTSDGATMLPATRTTKRWPSPQSKIISAGTRESEHERMMAKGDCPSRCSSRRPVPASTSRQRTLLT